MVSRKKNAVQAGAATRKKAKSRKGAKAGNKSGSHVPHNHFKRFEDEGLWRSGRYEITEVGGKCKLVRRKDGHVVGEYRDRVTAMAKADEDSGCGYIAPREERATWEPGDAPPDGTEWTAEKRETTSAQKVKEKQPTNVQKTELGRVSAALEDEGYFEVQNLEDERTKTLREIAQRQGQSQFRKKLLAAYGGRCAITGCDAEAALEAAHIFPYLGTTTNHVSNGLMLRADIHRLFDLGFIGIEPKSLEVALSSELAGTSYGDLDGKQVTLPKAKKEYPSREALKERWKQFAG